MGSRQESFIKDKTLSLGIQDLYLGSSGCCEGFLDQVFGVYPRYLDGAVAGSLVGLIIDDLMGFGQLLVLLQGPGLVWLSVYQVVCKASSRVIVCQQLRVFDVWRCNQGLKVVCDGAWRCLVPEWQSVQGGLIVEGSSVGQVGVCECLSDGLYNTCN